MKKYVVLNNISRQIVFLWVLCICMALESSLNLIYYYRRCLVPCGGGKMSPRISV